MRGESCKYGGEGRGREGGRGTLAEHEPFIRPRCCSHEMTSENYSEALRSPPPPGPRHGEGGEPTLVIVACLLLCVAELIEADVKCT